MPVFTACSSAHPVSKFSLQKLLITSFLYQRCLKKRECNSDLLANPQPEQQRGRNPFVRSRNLIARGQKARRIFEIIIHLKSDGPRRTKGVFARGGGTIQERLERKGEQEQRRSRNHANPREYRKWPTRRNGTGRVIRGPDH